MNNELLLDQNQLLFIINRNESEWVNQVIIILELWFQFELTLFQPHLMMAFHQIRIHILLDTSVEYLF